MREIMVLLLAVSALSACSHEKRRIQTMRECREQMKEDAGSKRMLVRLRECREVTREEIGEQQAEPEPPTKAPKSVEL